ncbi:MAG: GNAT family N-acetyltransferase [Chitinophagales bacterium]
MSLKSTIRFAKPEDLPQLIELVKAHAIFEEADALETKNLNRLNDYIFKTEILKCLVAEQDEKLIGYATFIKQFSTWNVNYYLYLDCLYLNEKTRGKGFGTAIMEAIKEYAKAENCKIIQWQTPDFNKKAIQFYNKIGAKSLAKERFMWAI